MYLFVQIARKSHFSSIRSLRSTKCSSEMLQNLPYFFDKKTHSPNYGFSYTYTKYSKLYSVSLEHFVERKPFIYEEWIQTFNSEFFNNEKHLQV